MNYMVGRIILMEGLYGFSGWWDYMEGRINSSEIKHCVLVSVRRIYGE